jgi:hypothetical protein
MVEPMAIGEHAPVYARSAAITDKPTEPHPIVA